MLISTNPQNVMFVDYDQWCSQMGTKGAFSPPPIFSFIFQNFFFHFFRIFLFLFLFFYLFLFYFNMTYPYIVIILSLKYIFNEY